MASLPSALKRGRQLAPVQQRWRWITGGLVLQLVGIGILIGVVLERADKDGLLGHLTGYTIRFVWREALRSHPDIALLLLGLLVFIAGSVVMARPFVPYSATLFVAVPVAAVVGVLVLGVIALVAFFAFAMADALWSGDGGLGGQYAPASTTRRTRDSLAADSNDPA